MDQLHEGQMASFNGTDKIIVSIIYAAIVVIGTTGNLVVLASICFRSEARKIQSNIFLVSLSLTDLLTSTLCGPYYLRSLHVSEFISDEQTRSWLCLTILIIAYFLAIQSILSLALISLDRFFAVRMPFWYQRRVTRGSCMTAVGLSWAYCIVIVFPPALKPGWIIYENDPGSPCGFQWEKANIVYIALNLSISFVIPAVAICITNVLVFKTARQQNRKIKEFLPANRAKQSFPDLDSPNYKSSEAKSRNNIATNDVNKAVEPSRQDELKIASSLPVGDEVQSRHLSRENITHPKVLYDSDALDYNPLFIIQPIQQHFYNSENDTNKCSSTINTEKLSMQAKSKQLIRNKLRITAKKEMKLVLATISLSVAFFISWMPFVLSRLLQSAGISNVSARVTNYGTVIAMLSSAWNPCVILVTRKEIFIGFKKIMNRLHEKLFRRKVSNQ